MVVGGVDRRSAQHCGARGDNHWTFMPRIQRVREVARGRSLSSRAINTGIHHCLHLSSFTDLKSLCMPKACWCHLCDSRFGVWSGNATSLNFLFEKMSCLIHLPDQSRIIRQGYADDIPFAKKFTDVHLPDQTPMLSFRNWSCFVKSALRGLVRQCDITKLSVRKNVLNYPVTGQHANYSATLCG
jgi:hypothetical protein